MGVPKPIRASEPDIGPDLLILALVQERVLVRVRNDPSYFFHLLLLQRTHIGCPGHCSSGEAFGTAPCLCTRTSSEGILPQGWPSPLC